MDPDASDWLSADPSPEEVETSAGDAVQSDAAASARPAPSIPTGPPVPNPYSHLVSTE